MSVTHIHVSFCQVLDRPLLKMEVLFQIVSYIGTGLMLESISAAAYKGKYHKSLYIGAGSALGWLVQVQAYCW